MSKQTVILGSGYDTEDAEPTRDAFDKLQDNDDELYASVASIEGDITTIKGDVTTLEGEVDALSIVTENPQTDDYVLVLADANKLVSIDKSVACTVTVPPNSSVAFPVGTMILIEQAGAGQATITAGSGVTINSYESALKLVGQYATCSLYKTATDTWLCVGNLEA